jgi:hypothetical protein
MWFNCIEVRSSLETTYKKKKTTNSGSSSDYIMSHKSKGLLHGSLILNIQIDLGTTLNSSLNSQILQPINEGEFGLVVVYARTDTMMVQHCRLND